jgi:hypothetical protein
MVKHLCHHFIIGVSADNNAAFASDLPDHESSHCDVPYGFGPNPPRSAMPEGAKESTRVQLCGSFAVELSGRRIDNMLPGRQGRLLFAYLRYELSKFHHASAVVDRGASAAPPPEARAFMPESANCL